MRDERPAEIDRRVAALEDVPIPVGPKLTNLSINDDWLSRDMSQNDWKWNAYEIMRALPRFAGLRPAFKQLAAAVHKASKRVVYVGRTGMHPDLLWARFNSHVQVRGAQYIRPVISVPTELAREKSWEEIAIRWVRRKAADGELCCNNIADDNRGKWPSADPTLKYAVARKAHISP